MGRITTPRVIAAVHDDLAMISGPVRNGPVCHDIGDSVGRFELPIDLEAAIAEIGFATRPFPAIRCPQNADFRPEPRHIIELKLTHIGLSKEMFPWPTGQGSRFLRWLESPRRMVLPRRIELRTSPLPRNCAPNKAPV